MKAYHFVVVSHPPHPGPGPQTEHKCVLDSCRSLEQEGFKVTYLPVQKNGLVDLNVLKEAINPETVMVSIMAVNNEIGVVQPLEQIGKMCRENKVRCKEAGRLGGGGGGEAATQVILPGHGTRVWTPDWDSRTTTTSHC